MNSFTSAGAAWRVVPGPTGSPSRPTQATMSVLSPHPWGTHEGRSLRADDRLQQLLSQRTKSARGSPSVRVDSLLRQKPNPNDDVTAAVAAASSARNRLNLVSLPHPFPNAAHCENFHRRLYHRGSFGRFEVFPRFNGACTRQPSTAASSAHYSAGPPTDQMIASDWARSPLSLGATSPVDLAPCGAAR